MAPKTGPEQARFIRCPSQTLCLGLVFMELAQQGRETEGSQDA